MDPYATKLEAENEELRRNVAALTCERDCMKAALELMATAAKEALATKEEIDKIQGSCPA